MARLLWCAIGAVEYIHFFEIASKWGEVLVYEIGTAKSLSFYCGKVTVLTECLKQINCTIKLSCDGKLFPVRIIEEQVNTDKTKEDDVNGRDTVASEEEEEAQAISGEGEEAQAMKEDVDVAQVKDMARSVNEESEKNEESLNSLDSMGNMQAAGDALVDSMEKTKYLSETGNPEQSFSRVGDSVCDKVVGNFGIREKHVRQELREERETGVSN
ncbi:hypothetical protein Dimus_033887 [Dionaea muscipula]